jgi:hypothetical protein
MEFKIISLSTKVKLLFTSSKFKQMLNRNLSAQTAAQKKFKCSLLQRPAIISAMLLLCAVLSTEAQTTSNKDSMFLSGLTLSSVTYGQPNEYRYDTIPLLMLLCDTLHHSNYTPSLNSANYFDKSGQVSWATGFSIRKITIEKAGLHQSGDMMWFNQSDKNYYETEKYLDSNYKPLSKYTMVWMAVSK